MSRKPKKSAEQLAALARADELIARRGLADKSPAPRRDRDRDGLSSKTVANRRAVEPARVVGPTIVTRPDGSRVEVEPMRRDDARRVIRSGKQRPRTWTDPGPGRYGGGNDFAT